MTHKATHVIIGVTTQPYNRRRNMCHYINFNTEERKMSRVLKAQGLSIRAIAKKLGRSPSSVSGKFKQNSCSGQVLQKHLTTTFLISSETFFDSFIF